jgi:ATP-dependent Clp protease adaptor protein ClpS
VTGQASRAGGHPGGRRAGVCGVRNALRALRRSTAPRGGRPHLHNPEVAVEAPVRIPQRSTDDRDHDDRPWQVIVLNDDHNTFEGVAFALSHTLPGVSYERGLELADRIHRSGRSVVWSGVRELAEHYHAQLAGFGLTMAPLEQV